VVDTINSNRSHESTLKREVNKLMRGEVEIKRDRLKQERYEANKKVIEKAIKITNEKEPQR